MKRQKNIFSKALLSVFVWVMATGCIFSEMGGSNKMQKVLIQVNVAADEMTKATGAVESNAETAINSIRIYAFYNGNLSGHFLRETASAEPIVMDLLLPYSGTHNVDFYVIANEKAMVASTGSPALGEHTAQDDLKKINLVSLNAPATNGLPMCYYTLLGVNVDNLREENTLEGHEGHYYLNQVLSVNLARPVSKIGVYAAEIEEGSNAYTTTSPKLTITDVQITNVISNGYLFQPETYPTTTAADVSDNTDVPVINIIGEQYGTAITDPDKYTQVFAPHYFFENGSGSDAWSAGYVESSTNLTEIAAGAMLVKIGYSFDSGATSSYAYVKMPKIERNKFYQVLCRFSPIGGHHEILITINEWNYITHTYEDVVVKG